MANGTTSFLAFFFLHCFWASARAAGRQPNHKPSKMAEPLSVLSMAMARQESSTKQPDARTAQSPFYWAMHALPGIKNHSRLGHLFSRRDGLFFVIRCIQSDASCRNNPQANLVELLNIPSSTNVRCITCEFINKMCSFIAIYFLALLL